MTKELPASSISRMFTSPVFLSAYSHKITDFPQPELRTLDPASVGSPVSIPASNFDSALASAVSPSQVLDAASASASTLLLATSTYSPRPDLPTLSVSSAASPIYVPVSTLDLAKASAPPPLQALDAAPVPTSVPPLAENAAISTCTICQPQYPIDFPQPDLPTLSVSSAAAPIYVPASTSDLAKASAPPPLQALDAAPVLPSVPPLAKNAAMSTRVAEHFLHKNRLQEYTQRASLDLPVYQTVNEGHAHAPKFRSTVFVDGCRYTSSNTFSHRKGAEQDVAKLAFECITKQIKDHGCPLVRQDKVFCKSILNEFAVRMNVDKPTYNTVLSQGLVPVFTSFLVFSGSSYTGEPAKTKKEAEQLAARAAILSILGNSGSGTTLSEIIKSKAKLYAALHKYKDVDYAQDNMASVTVNAGHSSENLVSREKKVEAADVSDNGPASVIRQLTSGMCPPCQEFNKLNPKPLPIAITLLITFVHPVMKEPLSYSPCSGKKRRKNKKNANKKSHTDV